MPTGSLPAEGKKIWERVHDQAIKDGKSEEVAAKIAWGAVKNAGWHKKGDEWVKSAAELQEFSLTIRKASFDPRTNDRRWKADTSDIDSDLYDDNMSMELFSDFMDRIERSELPPEAIREHYASEFWSGGMPYLSLSHYPDLDGEAVPGVVDAIFVDGKFLKAKGRLFDTALGTAVWNALKDDLEKKSDSNSPVRISIAFLDYKHKHKDTGTVFERDFSDPSKIVCSECRENSKKGKVGGKIFLKGLLIHLAMTRVPVNQRTIMEVEKAMTTRKEDAASIVGEELANTIDEKALEVGKADLEDAVVTRADDEAPTEVPTPEPEVPQADPVLATLNSLTEQIRSLTEIVEKMMGKDKKHMMENEDEGSPEDETEDKDEKKKSEVVLSEVVDDTVPDLAVVLSEAVAPLVQRMDIMIAALSQKTIPATSVPERRSISANTVAQLVPGQNTGLPEPGAPMKIGDFVKRSVGG